MFSATKCSVPCITNPQTNHNGLLTNSPNSSSNSPTNNSFFLVLFSLRFALQLFSFSLSANCSSLYHSLPLLVCKLFLALSFTPSPCLQTAPRFTIHFYTQLFSDAVDKGILPMSKLQPSFHQRFSAESSSLFSFLQLFQQPTTTTAN